MSARTSRTKVSASDLSRREGEVFHVGMRHGLMAMHAFTSAAFYFIVGMTGLVVGFSAATWMVALVVAFSWGILGIIGAKRLPYLWSVPRKPIGFRV